MNDSPTYYLRWRGRQFGPCTLAEINRKLDDHEIGMAHEIQYESRWISVGEFLRLLKPVAKPPMPSPVGGQAGLPVTSIPSAKTTPESASQISPKPPASTSARASASEDMPSVEELALVVPRRRMVFALLAILLGFLGVHNFYARHWMTGVIQLLVSLVSTLIGFGIFAPWLWAMAEAVSIRKDGYELEMT